MKHEVHISDMKQYLQCRRKWNWSSNLRENLERRGVYAPFFLGRMVHEAMQRYYDFGEHPTVSVPDCRRKEMEKLEEFGALWDSEIQVIDEQTDLALGMLTHYLSWQRTDTSFYGDANLHFFANETRFSVPLRTPSGRASSKTYLAGRFDGLVRRKDDGSFWIFETKTTRSIDELSNSLQNDMQAGAYIHAAREMWPDIHVSGILYNILRKKIPTQPEVLRNGTLTKRKNLDSTVEAYAAAIREQHPDWSREQIEGEYGEAIDRLMQVPNGFFARVPIYRTQAEIDELNEVMWYISLEMTRDSTYIYPNAGWLNCTFCHFRAPCLVMNAGGDYEFLIEQEYQQRTDWQDSTD